jgi:hypothetical protein
VLPELVFVNHLKSPGIDSQPAGIDCSKSIPGLHKRLQILALKTRHLVGELGVGGGGLDNFMQIWTRKHTPAQGLRYGLWIQICMKLIGWTQILNHIQMLILYSDLEKVHQIFNSYL